MNYTEFTQNDWRYYLAHADKKKESKWKWPGGKNSSEYNHHYYETHKEKWKKGLKNLKDNFDEATADITGVYYDKRADELEEQASQKAKEARSYLRDRNFEIKKYNQLNNEADNLYNEARDNRKRQEKTIGYKVTHPGKTLDKFDDKVRDKLGFDERERARHWERERDRRWEKMADRYEKDGDYEGYNIASNKYREALREYNKTPLGKAEKYVNKGKSAINKLMNKFKR